MEKDLIKGIAKCKLFDGIPENEIPGLFEAVPYRLIEKKKGEIIANAGEKCDKAYILIKGSVSGKLFSPSGQCVRVRNLTEGMVLAPAFLFATEKRFPVTVEATTDVILICINSAPFEKLIGSNCKLTRNLILIISNNVSFLSKRVRLLSFSLKERLCDYIYELKKLQGSVIVRIPMSRQQLAEFLGVQKNSVQRCLVELKKEGLIDFDKRTVKILKDPLTP